MRDESHWRETKFQMIGGRLVPSSDPEHLNVGSRIVAALQAQAYQRAIEMHAQGDLVDIGCGPVPLYALYRPRVKSITCIDWPGSRHGSRHVDLIANLDDGIPLGDASVDTLLATDVIEHLRDPDLFFAETARVLRTGGKAIVTTPFLYWLHEEPHDYHRYTEHRLRDVARTVGLEVLELEAYGGPLSVLLDIVGKNLPSLPWIRAHQRASTWFLETELGARIDRRNRSQFPLGYALVARKP